MIAVSDTDLGCEKSRQNKVEFTTTKPVDKINR